jgi:nitrogen fixation NifU-like protein
VYSRTVADHFLNPRNVGALEAPDAIGQVGSPGAGEFVVLHLRLQGEVIAEACFQTIGCGPAIAACSLLTEWVTGKTREQALALTSEQLIHLLGGLPPDKGFCAGLAIDALRNALGRLRQEW